MVLDLHTLYEALDVAEEEGPVRLMAAARREHYTLPYLVLSVLRAEGLPMGPAAAGQLRRAMDRDAFYRALLTETSAQAEVTPIKGVHLARHYPEGVLRPQGDLDLVTSTELDLWRAVRVLAGRPPRDIAVSVFGAAERHLMVALSWDSEEPLVDPHLRVDISTAALTGDFEVVPVRPALPGDPDLASLLCVAEERLQRPFHVRDALDVHALAQAELSVDDIVQAAGDYHLAPEVGELMEYAGDRVPLGGLSGLGDALTGPARRELDLRHERRAAATEAGGTLTALETGALLLGMPLGVRARSAELECSRVDVVGDEALLLTPVGDYLLVAEPLVDPGRYQAAVAAWESLDGPR
ncbi:nucleotidyltransferase family protein [Amycolatopsis sp. PS_44_ISF1]|uniref:nucleotidyltransferase family protein n=1 Tax=Amycolatopsis sp. PS_44_ISF1 TaxID=2974917 RepID=UPI0028E03C99|nr:nucleotidyltransferase family protein [Amycolatopsis sp. PS_44_ISF1]MDT8912744.1 nucleotidyltransferase family protein [Amycolatopsis sp. PS_44_ISF1]